MIETHLYACISPLIGTRLDLKVRSSQKWMGLRLRTTPSQEIGQLHLLDDGGSMRNLLYVVLELSEGWGWQVYLPTGLSFLASNVAFGTYAEAEHDAREFLGMTG